MYTSTVALYTTMEVHTARMPTSCSTVGSACTLKVAALHLDKQASFACPIFVATMYCLNAKRHICFLAGGALVYLVGGNTNLKVHEPQEPGLHHACYNNVSPTPPDFDWLVQRAYWCIGPA
jgi:hypothetical protein